jgi:hypothetical protein
MCQKATYAAQQKWRLAAEMIYSITSSARASSVSARSIR